MIPMTRFARYLGALIIIIAMMTGVMPLGAQEGSSSGTNSTDAILSVARLFGSAAISQQQNGDPLIAGTINHVPYALRLLNCTNRRDCEDLNFRVGFQIKPTPDVINTWNASKRFSRAYLDGEGDAILEMDVIVNGGVSTQMLNTNFEYWRISLDQFTQHIGFR